MPNQEGASCGESLLNRRWQSHKNAPSRGVFFVRMRITAAFAASLTLHLAAAMLDIQYLSMGKFPPPNAGGSRQKILATLGPPTSTDSQLLTSSAVDTGSNDLLPETDTAAATVLGQQASLSSEAQASSPAPVRYFERHEVDRPPRIIDNLDARDGPLDKALAEFDIDGSIVIEYSISDRGLVEKLNVINTTLPDAVVRIIIAQAEQAKFIPARLNHAAVPSRIVIELSIREKPKPPPI